MKMVGIEGISFSLGSGSLSNADLQLQKPSWPIEQLTKRTGVHNRTVSPESETALDMAERAVRKLMDLVGVNEEQIDALIFCTQTPDYILPPNSALLHGRLNMLNNVMAFDITHACSGFIYGLGLARSLVMSNTAGRVLLINADTYTRLLHDDDRSTRGIFGDGGAATLVSAISPIMSIIDSSFGTSGKNYEKFIVKSGGLRNPKQASQELSAGPLGNSGFRSPSFINMDGMGVLSFFNNVVPKAVRAILEKNDVNMDDVSHFVFHQASALALEGLQRSLRIPSEKVVNKMKDTGNLVSASIPVALAKAIDNRDFKAGDLIVLAGFGVGLSWGVTLTRWNASTK
jgi:3-oxoacyl-[acyl-carrier-protein] synthase-3